MKTLSTYFEDMVLSPEPNAFCMLKPGFNQYKDEFERLLKLNGWKIIKHCTKQFTRPEIEDFYIMHKDQGFYHKLCDYMITEACECYSCYKHCKDPYKEMGDFKKKIRDEWGEDEMRNGMHSSDNKENMLKESNIAFNTVNEKLKVSAKETVMMTNREFFELLKKYTNVTNYVAFLPTKLCNNVDEMPKYYKDETKCISLIQPFTTKSKNTIGLFLRDIHDFENVDYYEVNIDQDGDDIVDFTDEYWLNKIIKYMKEAISK